jgi:outer membrane protein insertion porin family
MKEQMQRPASVSSIEIHGARTTRRSFLDPLLKPVVDDNRNAGSTLADVLSSLQEVTSRLQRFGETRLCRAHRLLVYQGPGKLTSCEPADIFKDEPTVFISNANQTNPQAAASDIDISIKVAEKSRFMVKGGTDVGNAEGSAYVNAQVRNVFGGAESLSVNAGAGTRTRSAYSAVFATPINSNPDFRLTLEGLASATNKPWASHEEVLKGGALRLGWRQQDGSTHQLAYSGQWRQVTGLTNWASPTVRFDAGDSVKSSLIHTYTLDRRDNSILPRSGYLLRTTGEVAGWGPLAGDVAFSKSEAELAASVPLLHQGVDTGVAFGAGLRMGMLYPLPFGYSWTGPARPSRINDRFQLGGPTDVRGFKLSGLGPRDGTDAVGGDVYAAGGVNMLLPLPPLGAESPLRLQLFANGGRLVAMKNKGKDRDKDREADAVGNTTTATMSSSAVMSGMTSAVADLFNGLPSMAAGIGLVYGHPMARFELNFTLPLVLRRGEEGRKGFQVGVGINFL